MGILVILERKISYRGLKKKYQIIHVLYYCPFDLPVSKQCLIYKNVIMRLVKSRFDI